MLRQRRRRRERLPARIAAPNLAGSATTPSAAPYLCCCAYRLLPASIFLAIESLPTTGRPPGAVSTHPAASTHVAQHKRVPSCACLALQPPLTCMSLLRVPLPPPLPLPSQAAPLLCGHPAARSHPVKPCTCDQVRPNGTHRFCMRNHTCLTAGANALQLCGARQAPPAPLQLVRRTAGGGSSSVGADIQQPPQIEKYAGASACIPYLDVTRPSQRANRGAVAPDHLHSNLSESRPSAVMRLTRLRALQRAHGCAEPAPRAAFALLRARRLGAAPQRPLPRPRAEP